jgi:hypothetical protein
MKCPVRAFALVMLLVTAASAAPPARATSHGPRLRAATTRKASAVPVRKVKKRATARVQAARVAPMPVAPEPVPAAPPPLIVDGAHALILRVVHTFSRATARERVMQLLDYWRERFGVRSEWRGDRVFMSGSVAGVDIQARLDVTDSSVEGVASDPGWVWRSSGTAYVERKLRKYLSPSYDDPD